MLLAALLLAGGFDNVGAPLGLANAAPFNALVLLVLEDLEVLDVAASSCAFLVPPLVRPRGGLGGDEGGLAAAVAFFLGGICVVVYE